MTTLSYTIAIPVYERIMGYKEAIESALSVIGCAEIIICDDQSSHSEFETIALSYGDDRIKYFRNLTNLGLFANWNNCVQIASSEYVSILCSDDIILPDAFQNFKKAYDINPDIDVFFGSFCTFQTSIYKIETIKEFKYGPMPYINLLKDLVDNGPAFSVLTIARRSKLLQYPFVAKPHSGNDWLWIYSNASKLSLFAYDKPINLWRRHLNQDAVLSQSITMDCWPLMYINVYYQLLEQDKKYAMRCYARAEGTLMSWLINDKRNDGYWHTRLLSIDNENNFLNTMRNIINKNWFLVRMLHAKRSWIVFYNTARLLRKFGIILSRYNIYMIKKM